MNSSRRSFIKKSFLGSAFLAGSKILGIPADELFASDEKVAVQLRKGIGNLFLKNGKPLLIAVEGSNKTEMLKKGIEKLGGFDKLVRGRNVILKPNAVAPGPYPVSTDPDFLIAVGKTAIDAGAKKVSIFDSPGRSERIFKLMNLYEKTAGTGIELLPIDATVAKFFVAVKNPAWEIMKEISISTHLKEADVIINVPVVKRHLEAGFSCAMKNHFGSVYGPNRWDPHAKLHKGGSFNTWDESFKVPFKKIAAEFSDAVRCELNIVDAQHLLIKSGPLLDGAEIKKDVNRLIISGDIVATDAYCSSLMVKHDTTYSTDLWEPAIKYGEKLGLGISDIKKVELIEI